MDVVLAVLAVMFFVVVVTVPSLLGCWLWKQFKRNSARLDEMERRLSAGYAIAVQEETAPESKKTEAEISAQKLYDQISLGMNAVLGYDLGTARRALNGNEDRR